MAEASRHGRLLSEPEKPVPDVPLHKTRLRRHGRGHGMRAPLLGVPGPADALHGKVVPPAAAQLAEWAAAG